MIRQSEMGNSAPEARNPSQQSFVARCQSEWMTQLPQDLYIPPDALSIYLEVFEGPLDLLLYLIKKHNLDILSIQIAEICRQYMHYIEVMQIFHLELAAEYLEMAALLMEIKSRMLLPKDSKLPLDEEDPRAVLIKRLQVYEQFKEAALKLDNLPRQERDIHTIELATKALKKSPTQYESIAINDILMALLQVYKREDLKASHCIAKESLSVRDRMSNILSLLSAEKFQSMTNFFFKKEGRSGLIVTFLALLELVKESLIELDQSADYAPIYIRLKGELNG